jgi:hypothetical protein
MKNKLKEEEGFTEENIETVDKHMIFFKSIAEVRKNSADRREKMKPDNIKEVKSKVSVHFKERKVEEIPQAFQTKHKG